MIRKILVANRGEIALRIIRACKELNIKTVAIYSTADENSLHRMLADESYCVGSHKAVDSYLNMSSIVTIAHLSGCDAIHPGYGFLSENAVFAKMVLQCGLIFIGPNPDVIEKMGNKSTAKETMLKAGLPVITGSPILKSVTHAKEQAKKVGYPVMIKAVNGGGGKGMRVAMTIDELEDAFEIAKKEAFANFGEDEVYLEKYIVNPKHIEVQIIADMHGNVVHLFDRDCSIQRSRQKLIEEAPSTTLSATMKNKLYDASIKAAKYVNYNSVGTIEFLVKDDEFYFMEMNTRIQVEHPVTEMITNLDIVKMQIKVAEKKVLNIKQEDIKVHAHSIECRINAEDVSNDFKPSCGKITGLHFPGGKGIRVDSAIFTTYEVSPFYDSLLLKLIVFADTRKECLRKLKVALEEIIIEGINTNIDFHYRALYEDTFIDGTYDISFVDKMMKETDINDQFIPKSQETN